MINVGNGWQEILDSAFQQAYFKSLQSFLLKEKQEGFVILPAEDLIFNSFKITPFSNTKVVIIGQDPYHGEGQAHGLSFSVPKGIKVPPSLKNIYKELAIEYPHYIIPKHGDLTEWAMQGVLLLNATLTVRKNQAGSHQKKGWEKFTDDIITQLSAQKEGLIFILWGKYAQQKEILINSNKHHILKAAHPSPFAAHQGFFGCNHFLQCNQLLIQENKTPINWQIKPDDQQLLIF